MTTRVKKALAGVAAALVIGVAAAAAASPAAAFDASGHYRGHHHHSWRGVRPYGLPYASAYGEVPRALSGYYFTTSDFCIPTRNNGYNGGFATLAYGENGRVLGQVCH
ncbi:MAG TPA: hypothetical protein VIJ06_04945 [Methylovirgula sp.]